jgi:hypothetical protein
MKFILALVLPVFVFGGFFSLFGNSNNNTTKYNQQLININRKNTEVLQEYSKCMQKARGEREKTRECYKRKAMARNSLQQQKRAIYYNLKRERLLKQKKAMDNFRKNSKTIEKPEFEKQEFERN